LHAIKLLAGFISLTGFASATAATDIHPFTKAETAVNTLFPNERFSIWTYTSGDLNGDGIDDLGLVLTNTEGEGPRVERLAVLAGQSDGNYSILAVSDEFCNVRYHYNLDVTRKSLLVTGFSNLASPSKFTLQFRYNDQRKDFELIGEGWDDQNEKNTSSYSVSINYITKKIIYSRRKNNKHKEVEIQMKPHSLAGLKGFNCFNYGEDIQERNFYIDDDFVFKQ
jgi:hypothetical protein